MRLLRELFESKLAIIAAILSCLIFVAFGISTPVIALEITVEQQINLTVTPADPETMPPNTVLTSKDDSSAAADISVAIVVASGAIAAFVIIQIRKKAPKGSRRNVLTGVIIGGLMLAAGAVVNVGDSYAALGLVISTSRETVDISIDQGTTGAFNHNLDFSTTDDTLNWGILATSDDVPAGITLTVQSDDTGLIETPLPADIHSGSFATSDDVSFTVSIAVADNVAPGDYTFTITYTLETEENTDTITYIQDIDTAICPDIPTIFEDARDGHFYTVQKLADGKCWMLTNLAYGGPEAGVELTTGGGQSTTGSLAASDTNWERTSPPVNNQKQWVDPTTIGVIQSAGEGGIRCASAYRTSAEAIDYTECGFLYNWCAALGDGGANCDAASGNIADAGVGICPAGWRLPTGGPAGEFKALATVIGTTLSTWAGPSSTWRGVYSGLFAPGTGLYGQSNIGRYWSATAAYTTHGYGLFFDVSTVSPAYDLSKDSGRAVRCVADF